MSMVMMSPSSTRAMSPPAAASGEACPIDSPGAAGEPAVGDQGAHLAQTAALEEARRVQHLLHARTALGALVADDHHVTGLHRLVEDAVDRFLLAFEHLGRAAEGPQFLVDSRGLDDRAVRGEVAFEHGQAAVLGVSVLHRADAPGLAVQVQRIPPSALRERLSAALAARS